MKVETVARALVVVEHEMLAEHVGVRRVIVNYIVRLRRLGIETDLAIPLGGLLFRVDRAATRIWLESCTGGSVLSPGFSLDLHDHVDAPVDPSEYQISMISNPWLCAGIMPNVQFDFAVVYDLIPNLLALRLLDFGPISPGLSSFAYEHNRGFEYFLGHVRKVMCISESTRRDLVAFYGIEASRRAVVDTPFDPSAFKEAPDDRKSRGGRPKHLLLVNSLDPRKNYRKIQRAIVDLAATREGLEVDIVGRERIPIGAVEDMLAALATAGVKARWHRDATDAELDAFYLECDVLVFPSIYEGLGLPPLEAQMHGMPVITSRTSALTDLNLNQELLVDLGDDDSLTRVLGGFLDGDIEYLQGARLKYATAALVEALRSFEGLVLEILEGNKQRSPSAANDAR